MTVIRFEIDEITGVVKLQGPAKDLTTEQAQQVLESLQRQAHRLDNWCENRSNRVLLAAEDLTGNDVHNVHALTKSIGKLGAILKAWAD